MQRRSKDLRVGNIVLLQSGDKVPADMLFLASGHENSIAYVNNSMV
jgi:magnesium-transporting ATPase (P-type)